MAVRFTTIEKEAHAEQIINKSRFISHVFRADSREEADEAIKMVRSEFKDASHNVPAFVIGDKMQLQWGSDDGEPSGTAGAPIVQMLVKEGLTNLVMVVTRYYGGINLGTGGLVRAYTGTAKMALDLAGRHEVKDIRELEISLDYSLLDRLKNMEKSSPFEIKNINYSEKVQIVLDYEPEFDVYIKRALEDLCSGMPDIRNCVDKIY